MDFANNAHKVRLNSATKVSQLHRRLTKEEWFAEFVFQFLDAVGQGRLRHAQTLGRVSEVSLFTNRHEVSDLMHSHDLPTVADCEHDASPLRDNINNI